MKRILVLTCSVLAVAALLWIWRSDDRAPLAHSESQASAPVSADPADALESAAAASDEAAPRTRASAAAGASVEAAPRTVVGAVGARFAGTVVDPDGEPVPGALVEVLRGGSTGSVRADTFTDANGAFVFVADPDWPNGVVVQAVADGYARVRNGMTAAKPVVITLLWVTELFGQVRDAESAQPIAGATVTCGSNQVTTDAEGRYRIPRVVVDDQSLSASATGYADAFQHVVLRRRAPAQVDLEMQKCSALSVQVVDRETGQPIAGAKVSRTRQLFVETDAEGRFTLCATEGREFYFVVQSPGYAPLVWRWTVADVPAQPPLLPLTRWGFIEGNAVDATGRPLAGVGVSIVAEAGSEMGRFDRSELLSPEEKERFRVVGTLPRYTRMMLFERVEEVFSTRTDAAGHFTLRVIPGAASLDLRAELAGYHFEPQTGAVPNAGARAWVDFVGRGVAHIRGHARYNGEPCAGSVEWQTPEGKRLDGAWVDHETAAYSIEVAVTGKGVLLLHAPTGEVVGRAELEVEIGKTYEHDFDWVEEMSRITGKVTGLREEQNTEAWISARFAGESSTRSFSTRVLSDGTYVLPVPAQREYEVSAGRKTARRQREGVAAGATGVDFALPDLGQVQLRLVEAGTRAPVPSRASYERTVSWRESGGTSFLPIQLAIDVGGSCIAELPVGRVDLGIDLHDLGYVPRVVSDVEVAAGSSARTIEIERGVELQLRMIGERPSTETAKRRLVFLLRDDQIALVRGPFSDPGPPANHNFGGSGGIRMWLGDPHLIHQLVGCEGNTSLKGLAPGRYTLRAFPDDLSFEPAAIDVPATSVVDVRWTQR